MRLISRKALRQNWEKRGRRGSEQPLKIWARLVEGGNWKNPAELKADFPTADFVGNNRVILNMSGNKYRLIAAIHFEHGFVLVKFVGTHKEYDDIEDVTAVELPE